MSEKTDVEERLKRLGQLAIRLKAASYGETEDPVFASFLSDTADAVMSAIEAVTKASSGPEAI